MIVRRSSKGLLRTCKQVNVEATDILNEAYAFVFTETMHPIQANAHLELPEERQLLRRLILYGGINNVL